MIKVLIQIYKKLEVNREVREAVQLLPALRHQSSHFSHTTFDYRSEEVVSIQGVQYFVRRSAREVESENDMHNLGATCPCSVWCLVHCSFN